MDACCSTWFHDPRPACIPVHPTGRCVRRSKLLPLPLRSSNPMRPIEFCHVGKNESNPIRNKSLAPIHWPFFKKIFFFFLQGSFSSKEANESASRVERRLSASQLAPAPNIATHVCCNRIQPFLTVSCSSKLKLWSSCQVFELKFYRYTAVNIVREGVTDFVINRFLN